MAAAEKLAAIETGSKEAEAALEARKGEAESQEKAAERKGVELALQLTESQKANEAEARVGSKPHRSMRGPGTPSTERNGPDLVQ